MDRNNPALQGTTLDLDRKCQAIAKGTGERCLNAAIHGGWVCAIHGGKAPQTRAAANRRLLEAVEPATVRLLRIIEAPPGLCPTCGRCDDSSAVVAACRTVLRTALGSDVRLQVEHVDPVEVLPLDQQISHLETVLASLRAIRDARQGTGDIVDAEIALFRAYQNMKDAKVIDVEPVAPDTTDAVIVQPDGSVEL